MSVLRVASMVLMLLSTTTGPDLQVQATEAADEADTNSSFITSICRSNSSTAVYLLQKEQQHQP
jgi:hypothetical protein